MPMENANGRKTTVWALQKELSGSCQGVVRPSGLTLVLKIPRVLLALQSQTNSLVLITENLDCLQETFSFLSPGKGRSAFNLF